MFMKVNKWKGKGNWNTREHRSTTSFFNYRAKTAMPEATQTQLTCLDAKALYFHVTYYKSDGTKHALEKEVSQIDQNIFSTNTTHIES